jgi:hypothetical protein
MQLATAGLHVMFKFENPTTYDMHTTSTQTNTYEGILDE